ncbi:hypothetical protein LSUB1_G004598 [Lachnellula subtilissima]|uniref:DUF6604 domain-containing protein n=1 Tax=Lachnellula subtilissima TaxID=602034 RepID=A0A8H8RHE1_9HELO|nr:hypothetical protein LSUB1_G004598 [Lachnellula subtilissima]
MASQFVSGTYQSYKAGTGKVLYWLYENAQKCGYGVEQTEDSEEGEGEAQAKPPKKAKPKPKSKKGKGSKAKGSGKAKSKNTSASTGGSPKYVTVNELSALAEAIALSELKVKVPLWVTTMIEQVISGRKKSARWFSRQAGDTTNSDFEESNIGHQHFIEVLENVLSILIDLQEPTAKPATKKDGLDENDPLEQVINIFDALEIEPDTEHTMTEPTPSAPKAQKASPNVVFEEERSTEETLWLSRRTSSPPPSILHCIISAYCAIEEFFVFEEILANRIELVYCFFEDFNIARDHIKDLWTAYKRGVVDLPTAALSTNTAFELFKRAEDELVAELRSTLPPHLVNRIRGYYEIQGLLYMTTAKTRGQDPESRKSYDDPYNYQLWDIADWTCLNIYIILGSFLQVIQRGHVPVCKPGHFGKLNLNEDVLYPDEKFTQDKIVLLELLIPEFMFLLNVKDPRTRADIKFPAQDELTGGILEMVRTKEIPIWLVLALQVQLDIHYTLLGDISRPHSELSAAAVKATATITAHQDFSKDMHLDSWPKSNDNALEFCLWELDHWIKSDTLDPLRSNTFAELGFSKRGNFVLLKMHPVLCGLMLFRVNLNMQYIGLALVNAWGALPITLHLYNACLAERLLKNPWMDMEGIINVHTPKRIFVGDRPHTPQEYLKRFMLVMGYSASTFSTDIRLNPRRPNASKKGPRQMLGESVIAEIYADRYLRHLKAGDQDAQHSGFTLAAIEKLLEASTVPATDKDNTNNAADVLGGAFKTILMQNRPKKGLLPKFARSHRLSTLQLLTALEYSMSHESFASNVNYFSLHMRCFRLLRTIVAEMDPVFIKYFGPMYLEKEPQLPFLVGYIFQAVSGSSKAGEVLFPKIKSDEQGSKMLIQVSRIVARFIESEGEVETEKVKEASQVFEGFELETDIVSPTLDRVALKTTIQAFNVLPRRKTVPVSMVPTGPGPNHWHFSLRKVSHSLDPPDVVYLVSPENGLMHVGAPAQGSPILSLPTLADQADMVVLLLLGSFVKGVLKGDHAHHAKFAPWSWSCNDEALAKIVENKLKEYGVREEMCIVHYGNVAENELCEGVWATLKDHIVTGFRPQR